MRQARTNTLYKWQGKLAGRIGLEPNGSKIRRRQSSPSFAQSGAFNPCTRASEYSGDLAWQCVIFEFPPRLSFKLGASGPSISLRPFLHLLRLQGASFSKECFSWFLSRATARRFNSGNIGQMENLMRTLDVKEVSQVSGGLVPIIIGLVVLNAFIWGAVAGKNMAKEGIV
jgi:lactobin A/cerein 7B family class IIb bacteriocin